MTSSNINLDNTKCLEKIAFGGLTKFDSNSIELRIFQIKDNFRLHSCYYYDEALDVIKIASKESKIIPKLTTKVYFNFNTPNGYFTILDQIHRIVDKLSFIPKDWHIQICVNPSFKEFEKKNFSIFKEKVITNYGVVKYFIETECLWEKNTSKIIKSNYIDGSCFFMNGIFRSIRDECFLQKSFITYGMLAGGNKYNIRYKNFFKKYDTYDFKNLIEKNINFFLKLNRNKNFKYSITSVSSKKNYLDLINKIRIFENLYNLTENKIKINDLTDIFDYRESDSYGVVYDKFYKKYFYNKKRTIHEIKSLIPLINLSKKWF